MSGTITALTIQKKNKERVNVYLDDEYAFAVILNVALNLKKGQLLQDDEIDRLKNDDQISKAQHRALTYLSYRPRTCQEVRQYLQKKEITAEIVEIVVERLSDLNYLDDAEFGRLWAENRALHNPKGRRALQHELRQKGLTDADITQSLVDIDETALAWQAVQKRLRQWQHLDRPSLRQKLMGYLSRRGFNYDAIEAVFERVVQEINNS